MYFQGGPKKAIDLNLDAGESIDALKDGSEEKLYQCVSSVNIACGGHVGDQHSMQLAVELAQKHGLSVGAHPSFPDLQNFGREVMNIEPAKLTDSITQQIYLLKRICDSQKIRLNHVKPHGALYNLAAQDKAMAEVLLTSVRHIDPSLKIVMLAGSPALQWIQQAGFHSIAEAFVDRRYEADGSLRSRKHADAMVSDPNLAARQALDLAQSEEVKQLNFGSIRVLAQTLCIHGDTKDALQVARAVRDALTASGFNIISF